MSQSTEEIKSKISIVDLVSEYISLKRAGASYKSLCPFHHEKSPSFMVSPERQSWHCFGCNTGGDIFEFIMKMEGLEFPEALKLLADRAGVKLAAFSSEISGSQRNRLLDALKIAAKFYHKILLDSSIGAEAREYLKKRGVSQEMIEDFLIGYVPEEWDLLTIFLLKKGYGINDLMAAGLTIKKEGGGNYDRFRGRVMFPFFDPHGAIIGFTGRLLKEDKQEAGGKYVNTPQSIVFDKSRVLYGIDKAKQEIKREDKVIIVEGQMDVIACHQAGQTNVVASSGTALTREQIKLLKRFTNNLLIAFDFDAAGRNATERGIDLALADGMKIKVITLSKEIAKDPDECLKKNPVIWFKAAAEAKSIMDYFFEAFLAGRNLERPEERGVVSTLILQKIKQLPDLVEQDFWVKKLAGILDINLVILYEKLNALRVRNNAEAWISSSAGGSTDRTSGAIVVKTKEESASQKMLAIILRWPICFQPILETVKLEALFHKEAKECFKSLIEFYNFSGPDFSISDGFIHRFRSWNEGKEVCQILDLLGFLYDKEYSNLSQKEAKEEALFIAKSLNLWYNNAILKGIEKETGDAEKSGDAKKVSLLMQKFKDFL